MAVSAIFVTCACELCWAPAIWTYGKTHKAQVSTANSKVTNRDEVFLHTFVVVVRLVTFTQCNPALNIVLFLSNKLPFLS